MTSMLRNRDFLSGLLLLVFGGVALYAALGYSMGEARRMGPGFFPVVLSALLFGIGAIVTLRAVLVSGEAVEAVAFRPIVCVLASVILFGILLERAGLVASILLVVVISSLGGERAGIVQTLVLALTLCAMIVGIFVYALNIPFPLWPL